MTYDVGYPCCAEYGQMKREIARLTTELAAKWIKVTDRTPACSMVQNSRGILVLIWPHYDADGYSPSPIAFYGCRQSDEPNFYIYGRIIFPTYWAPLPDGPHR